jgi:V/A-type H+-transporting ATPase subunit D
MEVKKTKDELNELENEYKSKIYGYDYLAKLWNEFDPELITVKDIEFKTKKIAGVIVPVFDKIIFEEKPYSYFNAPLWYFDGIKFLKELAETGIKTEISAIKLEKLEHARRKTTQKVNLFEKVQIPGYENAILKIKRYLEDEESLSKSSQKIMRANLQKKERKEVDK